MDDFGLSDHELDEMLDGGSVPSGLADIANFLRDAPDAIAHQPSAMIEDRHLAAMTQAMRRAPEQPVPVRSARRKWAGRVSSVFGVATGKVAVTVGIALAVGGTLAATGQLPSPAQRVVSSTMQHVGIHLPQRAGSRRVLADARLKGRSPSEGLSRAANEFVRSKGRNASNRRTSGANAGHRTLGTPVWRAIACRCATYDEASATMDELTADRSFSNWSWEIDKIEAPGGSSYYEVENEFAGTSAKADSMQLASRLREAGFSDAVNEEVPP